MNNINIVGFKKLMVLTKNYLVLVFILSNSFGYAQDWQLVWSDEFDGNGEINLENWFHQTQLPSGGSWYNGEVQHYTNRTENSYVSNGTLKIVARDETYTDQGHTKEYTSARLNSKYAFTYGRVEIKAKLPQGVGTWPAIWMLGKNINEAGAYWQTQGYGTTSWPACGEVDIMEHWGSNQNYIQSAIHTPSSYGGTFNLGGQYISTASSQFHIYTIDWSAQEMIFSVDGNVHYTYDPASHNPDTWPFDSELYLLLNIAIEPNIASSFTESSMEIDYIRVYEYQDSCADIICDGDQTCDNGDCVDIPTDPTVTFLVDMQYEEVNETGMHVSGGDPQLAGPSGLLMSYQGNGIWSLTVSISPGTYTYKFRNGFYTDWNGPGWEPGLPAECGFGEWNDRQFTFSNIDMVLGPYYFGSCELSESDNVLGDVNADGIINILDVVQIVSFILGNMEFGQEQEILSDINADGAVNVLDIVQLVNFILGE